MHKLIKDGQIVNDDQWTLISEKPEDQDWDLDQMLTQQPVIIPLELWLANRESLAENAQVGVWLDSDQEPDVLGDDLSSLPIIAINFPGFADGRGYSHARRLRLNFDYKGDIRAFGDVLRDQLLFYKRCGFSSFSLRSDSDAENAIEGLKDFDVFYQDADDDVVPPFAKY